jgi:hypothetical protein
VTDPGKRSGARRGGGPLRLLHFTARGQGVLGLFDRV